MHNRFAFPVACLVLMLVGVPLGAASRRGGKSSGFVFTILLVFVYYFLSSTGIALGHQSRLPAFLRCGRPTCCLPRPASFCSGRWPPAAGSLQRHCGLGFALAQTQELRPRPTDSSSTGSSTGCSRARRRTKPRGIFPRILDEYIVREFLTMFSLVLAGFVLLMIVFTFFDLVGDILRNHIPLAIVGDYLLNLTPSMLYQIAPLAVLIAALVTFGVLNRNSEIVAIKATGISLYRLVIPIVSIAACLAVSLFLFDQYYLPQANRRQEALRNVIKGRPPQTYLHPEQKWIFGQTAPRRARAHLLLRVLRSRSQRIRQSLGLRVRSLTFSLTRRIFASAPSGMPIRTVLALRERLGARHRGRQL